MKQYSCGVKHFLELIIIVTISIKRLNSRNKLGCHDRSSRVIECETLLFHEYLQGYRSLLSIVNSDMVWKLGELQSVYNELSFYVELASPCTNLLKFCLLIFQ